MKLKKTELIYKEQECSPQSETNLKSPDSLKAKCNTNQDLEISQVQMSNFNFLEG
jgi:hypothetical protein